MTQFVGQNTIRERLNKELDKLGTNSVHYKGFFTVAEKLSAGVLSYNEYKSSSNRRQIESLNAVWNNLSKAEKGQLILQASEEFSYEDAEDLEGKAKLLMASVFDKARSNSTMYGDSVMDEELNQRKANAGRRPDTGLYEDWYLNVLTETQKMGGTQLNFRATSGKQLLPQLRTSSKEAVVQLASSDIDNSTLIGTDLTTARTIKGGQIDGTTIFADDKTKHRRVYVRRDPQTGEILNLPDQTKKVKDAYDILVEREVDNTNSDTISPTRLEYLKQQAERQVGIGGDVVSMYMIENALVTGAEENMAYIDAVRDAYPDAVKVEKSALTDELVSTKEKTTGTAQGDGEFTWWGQNEGAFRMSIFMEAPNQDALRRLDKNAIKSENPNFDSYEMRNADPNNTGATRRGRSTSTGTTIGQYSLEDPK